MKRKEEKIIVLKEIAHRFNEAGIVWALGASMLLYFKGITSDFHDIDLMVGNENADQARKILLEMGCMVPSEPDTRCQSRIFMEFVIDGVDVDVMVGFTIVCDHKRIDCSLQKDQIAEILDVDGEQIPLQSVEQWCEYYRLMGRTEKVKMIERSLASK